MAYTLPVVESAVKMVLHGEIGMCFLKCSPRYMSWHKIGLCKKALEQRREPLLFHKTNNIINLAV